MKLVKEKGGFAVYFDSVNQEYKVYKDGKLFVDGMYRYKDVKTYVE